MQFIITEGWLQKRAALDEKAEVSTGSLEMGELLEEADNLRVTPSEKRSLVTAFGRLILLLRMQRGLSITKLAEKADIDESEIESIEKDREYIPEPRTVFQLSKLFKLPEKSMLQLTGHLIAADSGLTVQAVRFATNAKGLDKLNKEQHEALREFVKYLSDHN